MVVNGVSQKALLDTSSSVSTIPESFYKEFLVSLEIKPLADFIHIECADGEGLKYQGYDEVSLETCCLSPGHATFCLFLVVQSVQPECSLYKQLP